MGIKKLKPKIVRTPWGGSLLKEQGFCGDEKAGEIWGTVGPMLMKIIGAQEDLSVQVHPNDDYAISVEKETNGKTECWFVLSCDEDSSIVLGHNAKTREDLEEKVRKGNWSELLREVPVEEGDFFYIEAGTIHSIGGGITLLEIQQNSDITYRFHDYDRVYNGKKRELHIEKALDNAIVPYIDSKYNKKRDETDLLCNSNKFYIRREVINEEKKIIVSDYPTGIVVIEGEGNIDDIDVKKGDFLSTESNTKEIQCNGKMTVVISSYLKANE